MASMMKCYDCQRMVASLKDHRANGGCTKGNKGPEKNNRAGTVECYDCHQQVTDLKSHRAVCPGKNGRGASSSSTSSSISSPTATSTSSTLFVYQKEVNVERKEEKGGKKEDSMDVFMLIDVSGSMAGNRLENAKTALRQISDTMEENDRLAILTFDSNAFYKLKPRPVGQIRRQQELDPLLARIFAQGSTALYDAIFLCFDSIRDKNNRRTKIVVLTDGMDNASRHSLAEVNALLDGFPNVSLDIVHIADSAELNPSYAELADRGRGEYQVIVETEIVVSMVTVVRKVYLR